MDPWEEGYAAYTAGDPKSMNPYDVNDAQFDDWDDGAYYEQEA